MIINYYNDKILQRKTHPFIMENFATRSREYGTFHYNSLQTAISAYDRDSSIFKISYSINDVDYRWIPKRKQARWGDLSEQLISELCPIYIKAKSLDLFWVNQDVSLKD